MIYAPLVLALATTVFEDLRTPVTAVKLSGTKPPIWASYKSSEVLGFSDQAFLEVLD